MILVLFLFSSAGFADTSECNQFLEVELRELTPARQKYVDIANASKRLRAGKASITNSIENDIVKDFILSNLKKIDEKIKTQMPQVVDNRVLDILEKLNKVRHAFLNSKVQNLTKYRRLALLYAQLMDFLPNLTANDLLFNHIETYKGQAQRNLKVVSIVLHDDTVLSNWVESGGLFINQARSSNPIKSDSIPDPFDDIEFIPTFANLGFRTLLWGRSRGIEFIGQTSNLVNVDGSEYMPSLFSLHDYAHAIYSNRVPISVSTLFWNKIEAHLNQLNLSEREIKLIEALLFIMYHEYNNPMSFTNVGNKPTFVLENVVTAKIGAVIRRLNNKNDLGQALEGEVTITEINSVFFIMYNMFNELRP